MTLAELARLTGYSPQHIGAVERGCAGPSETMVARADMVLEASGRLLLLLPDAIAEQAHIRHRREAARRTGQVAERTLCAEEHLAWERLAHVSRRCSRVTPTVVDDLELITDRQRCLYHELSSAEMVAQVQAHHGLLTTFLRAASPDPLRRRIASAAAEAAGFAAWLWFDLGDSFRTSLLYRESHDALGEGADPGLASYVKGYEGLAAWERGRRDSAAALIGEACDRAPGRLSAGTRAWLEALNANVLATIGERREALAALDRAERYQRAKHAEVGDPWMFDFDDSSLAGLRGSCHLSLGETVTAVAGFEDALACIPESCDRRRATVQIGLAHAHVYAGEVSEACTLVHSALQTFVRRGSVAGVRRVRRVRNALRKAGYEVAARAVDEQVRAFQISNS